MGEKVAGGILIDGQQVAETLQCAHCGEHWIRKVGSGTMRGFCLKCDKVLCGAEPCMVECKPFEKWLEEVEKKGRIEDPIRREQAEEDIETLRQSEELIIVKR